eukprot:1061697-Prorocentrum_minimum.AAC.4
MVQELSCVMHSRGTKTCLSCAGRDSEAPSGVREACCDKSLNCYPNFIPGGSSERSDSYLQGKITRLRVAE